MPSPLDGGAVLITGASSGIGQQIALQLAHRASRLVLVARRVERLQALSEQLTADNPSLQVHLHPADLSDRDQVMALADAMLDSAHPVDVLVNNAGIGDHARFEDADLDKLERMILLNVLAPTLLTKRLLPPMIERKRGGFLNISSGFGLVTMPGFGTYCGTKHYVTALTDALAGELSGRGVHVTQVCPGPVKTEFAEVAELDSGIHPPGFVWMDSADCARHAIAGFDRNQPLVIPGVTMKTALAMGQTLPRWVYRQVGARIAGAAKGG